MKMEKINVWNKPTIISVFRFFVCSGQMKPSKCQSHLKKCFKCEWFLCTVLEIKQKFLDGCLKNSES